MEADDDRVLCRLLNCLTGLFDQSVTQGTPTLWFPFKTLATPKFGYPRKRRATHSGLGRDVFLDGCLRNQQQIQRRPLCAICRLTLESHLWGQHLGGLGCSSVRIAPMLLQFQWVAFSRERNWKSKLTSLATVPVRWFLRDHQGYPANRFMILAPKQPSAPINSLLEFLDPQLFGLDHFSGKQKVRLLFLAIYSGSE